jgi:hypothetical protein
MSFSSLMEYGVDMFRRINNTRTLQMLLELDLKTNLRILNAVQLDASEPEQGNPEFAKIALILKTEIIALILIEGRKLKIFWNGTVKFLDDCVEGKGQGGGMDTLYKILEQLEKEKGIKSHLIPINAQIT